MRKSSVVAFISVILYIPIISYAGIPTISGVTPVPNVFNVESNSAITVTFTEEMNSSTFTNSTVKIYGSISGMHSTIFNYTPGIKTLTINPNIGFQIGELVSVILTRGIKSISGDGILKPYIWNFTIGVTSTSPHFYESSVLTISNIARSAAVGDLDNDGQICAIFAEDNLIEIYKNNGSGTFSLINTISITQPVKSMAVGDVDCDDHLEIITLDYSSNLNIYKNSSGNNFTLNFSLPVNGGPSSFCLADFDGDGYIDIVMARSTNSSAAILINDGTGTFTIAGNPVVNGGQNFCTVGDFDNDGDIDIALVDDQWASHSYVLQNDGTGEFQMIQSMSPMTFGSYPQSIDVGDYNKDGYLDLFAGCWYNSNGTEVFINDSTGKFTIKKAYGEGNNPHPIKVGDWSGDGKLGVAAGNGGLYTVSIFLQDSNGELQENQIVPVNATPSIIRSADIYGNKALDLLVVNSASNTVSILKNCPRSASVLLSSTTINFGGIKYGNSKIQNLRITNEGTDSSLYISNISSSNSAFSVDKQSTTISPSKSGTIQITFNPTSPGVTYFDSLTLLCNDARKPTLKVYVTGTSSPPTPTLNSPENSALGISSSPLLIWNTSNGATLYHIQVSRDSIFTNLVVDDSIVTMTFKQVNSLTNNTNYYWRVASKNIGGTSDYSKVWKFTTVLATPTITLPANQSTNIDLQPSLIWNAVDGAIQYRAQVAIDSLLTNMVVNDSTITTTSRQLGTLSYSTTYYWRVLASNNNGSSAFSNVFRFTTIIEKPSAPILISPIDGSNNQPITLTLMWNAADRASRYRLQVATDSLFSNMVENDSTITTSTKDVSSLEGSTRYYWRVQAENIGGVSNFSTFWSFTTVVPSPTIQTILSGNKRLTLNWASPSVPNIVRYRIYCGTVSHHLSIVDSVSAPAVSFLIDSLSNNQRYYVAISSVNQFLVESALSNEVNASPLNMLPHATSITDVTNSTTGRVLKQSVTYSVNGSTDQDGTIDSIYWYVNNILVTKSNELNYAFGPGTNKVMLIVKDNDGGQDTSRATVTRLFFRSTLGGPIYSGVSLLGDDIMYAVASGDAIYRLHTDGSIEYPLQVGGEIRATSSISYDTCIYIASSLRNLYAFSKTGTSLWPSLDLGGELSVTPTIDSISDKLYVGVANRNFQAINRKTGTIAWNFFSDAPIRNSAVITQDRRLFFSTVKGTMYGIDLNNIGSPVTPTWTIPFEDTITTSPAIDLEGNFYVGTLSGKILKILMTPTQSGTILWQTQLQSSITSSPVIDAVGTLYVGTSEGKLYAISIQDGVVKWSFQSSGSIHSTASIGNNGVIYFGNDKGMLYAIDTSSNLQWYYEDSSSIVAPTLTYNGITYIGSSSGHLLGIYDGPDSTSSGNPKLGKVALQSSPVWGTFQGNNQRNGVQVHIKTNSVNEITTTILTSYSLSQNYPNPFNPSTTIQYGLPKRSRVRIQIFDILGQKVNEVINAEQNAGVQSIIWNANVASGMYFYRIDAINISDPSQRFVETKKMLLLR